MPGVRAIRGSARSIATVKETFADSGRCREAPYIAPGPRGFGSPEAPNVAFVLRETFENAEPLILWSSRRSQNLPLFATSRFDCRRA